MDFHLCEPHFFSSIFKCNFCTAFRTEKKEDYRKHLQLVHGREAKFDKPFMSFDLMCDTCDFECFSYSSIEYLEKHKTANCPFRAENIERSVVLAKNSPIKKYTFANYKFILENMLAPEYIDLLDYHFIFGVKPNDHAVNKYNLFIQAVNNSSSVSLQTKQNEMNQFRQIKILEALIKEDILMQTSDKSNLIISSNSIEPGVSKCSMPKLPLPVFQKKIIRRNEQQNVSVLVLAYKIVNKKIGHIKQCDIF